MSPVAPRLVAVVCPLLLTAGTAIAEMPGPRFPTTEFEDGAKGASVTVGDVTAKISMVRRPKVDPDYDVPVLSVLVGDRPMLEAVGVASGFDFPAAEASIVDIDPNNARPEVYFTSFSGGMHCCTQVIVGTQVGDKWVAVPIGSFDGDGDFLNDLDSDGLAEIVTVDNRFLYEFDCYACSAAPLQVFSVRRGALVDASAEIQFLPAHREWLQQMEASVTSADRWTSRGFLAGWVAAKSRVGEGAAAMVELDERWDHASDEGEEVCLTGGAIENCPKRQRAVLKFPDRLKLFLEQNGYPLT
ncbi:MAG TPA: hypothetical protein VFK86_11755 [Bauldia sp.]|nr:hypothetical protein [Bauldia sp.]